MARMASAMFAHFWGTVPQGSTSAASVPRHSHSPWCTESARESASNSGAELVPTSYCNPPLGKTHREVCCDFLTSVYRCSGNVTALLDETRWGVCQMWYALD